jgi:hypothetical protein
VGEWSALPWGREMIIRTSSHQYMGSDLTVCRTQRLLSVRCTRSFAGRRIPEAFAGIHARGSLPPAQPASQRVASAIDCVA